MQACQDISVPGKRAHVLPLPSMAQPHLIPLKSTQIVLHLAQNKSLHPSFLMFTLLDIKSRINNPGQG
jgi:hypothetical protein